MIIKKEHIALSKWYRNILPHPRNFNHEVVQLQFNPKRQTRQAEQVNE